MHQFPYFFFKETTSTNDEARLLAKKQKPHTWQIIWTEHQTKGRGRYQRHWEFLKGNLACSFLVPNIEYRKGAELSFLSSLAVLHAINDFLPSGKKASLKWPNDVWINGRKAAGLLLESCEPSYMIIGIGVNLFQSPTHLPATCLTAEGAENITPSTFLPCLASYFQKYNNLWKEKGFEVIREEWLSFMIHKKGDKMQVQIGQNFFSGCFVGIDIDGALIIEHPDKGQRRITAGDVYHVAGD